MDEAFWQRRWTRNEIGFHLNEINPYLRRHWQSLGLAHGSRVLVPLCGKSLDMAWLADQGHSVLGVELSERAVEDFFAERGLVADVSVHDKFKVFRSGSMEIFCGDFFALNRADVADCQAIYDRAALIAMPDGMRQRYVEHLLSILPPSSVGLLITLDYPQEQMAGPPFAVGEDEVYRWLSSRWNIELLERANVLDESNWKFLQRGLTRLDECCYRLDSRE
ncbi:thiopurine S-methyltransferase [Stutzerimonas stutzeri]|uniref:thiopurine S-methyltransferase n=1 Tax=Stutzerimonas stutzeri TaxID=316 RepID=UPI002109D63E|nr:thiopurine S-methyltransferase [Stutzerimonas stutzeri]